ncbi:MAG: helix-turn-helix domain-containing protein [Myxococcota bacterium]
MAAASKEGRRDDIVEAARTLFSSGGYDATSLDAILRRAGASKGTLYHYFDSKEDLYATVLETLFDSLWVDHDVLASLDIESPEEYWAVVTLGMKRSAQHMLSNPDDMALWRDFQEHWRLLADSGPAGRLRERALSISMRLVSKGQELGCVRCDLSARQCAELVEAIDLVCDSWFFELADRRGADYAMDLALPRSIDFMRRVLAPPFAVDIVHGGFQEAAAE